MTADFFLFCFYLFAWSELGDGLFGWFDWWWEESVPDCLVGWVDVGRGYSEEWCIPACEWGGRLIAHGEVFQGCWCIWEAG